MTIKIIKTPITKAITTIQISTTIVIPNLAVVTSIAGPMVHVATKVQIANAARMDTKMTQLSPTNLVEALILAKPTDGVRQMNLIN